MEMWDLNFKLVAPIFFRFRVGVLARIRYKDFLLFRSLFILFSFPIYYSVHLFHSLISVENNIYDKFGFAISLLFFIS